MQKVGNKYYTDFMIPILEDKEKHIPAQEKCVYENLNLFWNALEKGLVKLVSVIFTKDARLTQRIPQSCMLPLIASIMGRFSFVIGLTIGT